MGKRQREALKNGTKEPSSKDNGAAPSGNAVPDDQFPLPGSPALNARHHCLAAEPTEAAAWCLMPIADGDKAPEKKQKKVSSDEPDAPGSKVHSAKDKAATQTPKPAPEATAYKVALPNKRRGGKKDKAVPIGVKPKISKGGQRGGRKGGPSRSGGGRGRGDARGGKARRARS